MSVLPYEVSSESSSLVCSRYRFEYQAETIGAIGAYPLAKLPVRLLRDLLDDAPSFDDTERLLTVLALLSALAVSVSNVSLGEF